MGLTQDPRPQSGPSTAYGDDVSDQRRGFLLGVAAYVMWGLFPLYWPLLEPAGPWRSWPTGCAWSLVTMVALTVLLRAHDAAAGDPAVAPQRSSC